MISTICELIGGTGSISADERLDNGQRNSPADHRSAAPIQDYPGPKDLDTPITSPNLLRTADNRVALTSLGVSRRPLEV